MSFDMQRASHEPSAPGDDPPISGPGDARLVAVEAGERMLIWCEGGPSLGRAVHFPPPLEIAVDSGLYVLVDDGPPHSWHYAFVSDADMGG